MAKIEKLKKGTATIYPATIPQAVVDPATEKTVREELDERANHGYESNPKSLKEVDDEKADHGYAVEETPKTLKEVDDEVSQLAGNTFYKGVATPSTNPGYPDGPVFYMASTPGVYSNFNGIVVYPGEVCIIKYDTTWNKFILTNIYDQTKTIGSLYKFNGYIQKSTGVLISNSSLYKTTDYMPINGDIYVSLATEGSTSIGSASISFFDSNKNYMTSYDPGSTGSIPDISIPYNNIPTGARFWRTSCPASSDPIVVGGEIVRHLIDDLINVVEGEFTEETININPVFEFGGINIPDGSLLENTIRARSEVVEIEPNSVLNITNNSGLTTAAVAYYLDGDFVSNSFVIPTSISTDGTFNEVRFSFKKVGDAEFTSQDLLDLSSNFTIEKYTKTYPSDSAMGRITKIEQNIGEYNNAISKLDDLINVVEGEFTEETININPVFEFGGIQSTDGALLENTIRARSEVVEIEPNSVLNITNNSGFSPAIIAYYLDGAFVSSTSGVMPTSISSDGSFNEVRFSFTKGGAEFTSQDLLDLSSNFTIEKYTKTYPDDSAMGRITKLEQNIWEDNKFQGLKLASLGDSITYGFIPRNYNGYPGQLDSYAKLTAQDLGMIFQNKGIIGSTVGALSIGDNTNSPFVYRFDDLADDADIITVMGGTNDVRKGIPLGSFSDTDETTFYGALKILCQGLYDKYMINQGTSEGKEKRIILCTPIKLLGTSSGVIGGTGTLYSWDGYINAIKEVAAYFSFHVVDFYNLSNINPHLSQTIQGTEPGYTGTYNPYITDGTHPTQEGARMMADLLTGFLKTIK